MKREILFRGKRTDNGEWVEGDLIHGVSTRSGKMYILPIVSNLAYLKGCDPLDGYEVIPDSVCQFTCITDKNGTKIFEGDIINLSNKCGKIEISNAKVYYEEASFKINKSIGCYSNFLYGWNLDYEVIGNAHDNPELVNR